MGENSLFDLETCSAITKAILDHHFGGYFEYPVDPKDPLFPKYDQIVKNPIDLSIIQSKLSNRIYQNPDEWIADINLMFDNSRRYYGKGAFFTSITNRLDEYFHKLLEKEMRKSRAGFLKYSKKLLAKVDDLLANPPSSISYDLKFTPPKPITVSDNEMYEFSVAAALLSNKSDIFALTQILESNGITFNHKVEQPMIDYTIINDQGKYELVSYAKARFKEMGIPYPKKGITI